MPGLLAVSYAENTGMAFGLLKSHATAIIAISIIVAAAIILMRKSFKGSAETLAAALVLGGTLANLIDRLFRGAVIDYISVKGIPMFNIADASLTAGAALIIAAYIVQKLKK